MTRVAVIQINKSTKQPESKRELDYTEDYGKMQKDQID